MIKSIRLVNWRSHADSRLDFRKGTNLLVGIMGAGKSSILEAISFALFGTFPALERRKLKLENILRLNEPLAKVELVFDWDGVDYRIERTIERSKKAITTGAEIYKHDSIVEHGSVAVTTYIQNLLGIDYDLFTRAIYSEQNNIDYFLNLDPRKRKEEIDALLGLDRFELARANIVTVINNLRVKRAALESRFSKEKLAESEAKMKKHEEERSTIESSLAKNLTASAAHSKDAATTIAKFEEMRRSKERYESLEKECIRFSAQLESMKKELEGKVPDEQEHKRMEARLHSLSEERSKLNTSQKSIEDRNSVLSKELGSIDARQKAAIEAKSKLAALESESKVLLQGRPIQEVIETQKALEQTILSIESERKALQHEMSELSESLPRLKPGLSECPLCSSKLTDDGISHVKTEKEHLIKQKKARSEELSSQMPQRKAEHEALILKIRRVSLIIDKLVSLKQEADASESLKIRRSQLDDASSKLLEERKAISISMEKLAEELDKTRTATNEITRLVARRKEADLLDKKSAESRKSLSMVLFDPKTFESLRESAEKSRLETERLSSERKSLEKDLKSSSDMSGMLKSELDTLRALEKDIHSSASLEEQLSFYKNALLETQTGLRIGLADAINTAMNEIWGLFYPYKNYRALRLGVSEKDYLFEVDDGNGWKGLETIASGGERACAALALRAALAMVLTPKLGWLILDEPTHNLDSEAVEMLSSALQFKVPEVVNQTFVITHDEAFMGSEFASSYRLKRDKGQNGHTIVETM
jgi:exonuclease SbcC